MWGTAAMFRIGHLPPATGINRVGNNRSETMMKPSNRERFVVFGATIIATLVTFSGTTQAMTIDLKKPQGARVVSVTA
jgi:hypothetical protein